MNPMQDTKLVVITPPAAIIDNSAVTTGSVDTQGFRYATVVVMLGATDIALTVLKLQHSDTDSSYADITGADFSSGTLIDGTAATVPSATDDNKFFVFDVKLTKRYLDLAATVGDGTAGGYVSAFAILSQSESALGTSALRGADGVIRV